jgi:hypothetical protein
MRFATLVVSVVLVTSVMALVFPTGVLCRTPNVTTLYEPTKMGAIVVADDAGALPSTPTLPTGQIPAGPVARFGPAHELSPAFFGANIDNVYIPNILWSDAAAKNAIMQDGFRNLRFPMGDFGSYYNWETAWLWPNFLQDCIGGTAERPLSYSDSVVHLATLLDETHTSPLYELNVLTENVTNANGQFVSPRLSGQELGLVQQYQIAMLKAASSHGVSVPFVELGNEIFWGSSPGCPDTDINYASGPATPSR